MSFLFLFLFFLFYFFLFGNWGIINDYSSLIIKIFVIFSSHLCSILGRAGILMDSLAPFIIVYDPEQVLNFRHMFPITYMTDLPHTLAFFPTCFVYDCLMAWQ